MDESKPDSTEAKKRRMSLRLKKGQEWLKEEYEKIAQESESLNLNDLALMALKDALPGIRKKVSALVGEGFQVSAMT